MYTHSTSKQLAHLVRKTERLRELGAKTSKKINPKLLDRSE